MGDVTEHRSRPRCDGGMRPAREAIRMREQSEQGGVIETVHADHDEGGAERVFARVGGSRPAAPLVRRLMLAPQLGSAVGYDRDLARDPIVGRGKVAGDGAEAIGGLGGGIHAHARCRTCRPCSSTHPAQNDARARRAFARVSCIITSGTVAEGGWVEGVVRDKGLFCQRQTNDAPTPFYPTRRARQVTIDYAVLKARSADVSAALADARSAPNLSSRRKRAEERDEQIAEGVRRRRKSITDREADAALKRRLRIRVPEADRPRTGSRTPRRLFTRAIEQMLKGTTGLTDARGPDGRHSIHYSFTARGFGSKKGRRWRAGEAERAALYSVREDALEDGELGWWSSIAADRNELVAHYRALEALEKHDRANANVYIVEIIALPAELSAAQRRDAARGLCRRLERLGLAYTVGIHRPDAAGDQRNYHLHLVYSMRPCQRVAPYEWDFATAKLTEINTPAGIMQRRCGVVVAVNETLRDAGIAKRYTPLSNRERGMAPPECGKIGQQETAMARRLAALEDRQARLAALQAHTRWVRQTLLDAADRLEAARRKVTRRKVTRRLAAASIALSQDAAERIMPAERRGKVRAALERAYHIIDRSTAMADRRLVSTQRAMHSRLHLAATHIRLPMDELARADNRVDVIKRLDAAAVHAGDTIRRVRTDVEQARLRMPATEEPLAARPAGHEDLVTTAADPDLAAAIRSAATADAEQAKAEQAAHAIALLMVDKALASLRRKAKTVQRDDTGLFVADTTGLPVLEKRELEQRMADPVVQAALADLFASQVAEPPIATGELTTTNVAPAQHDRYLGKEPGRDRHGRNEDKGVPCRRAGLRPPSLLAGLRVLRAVGVDDRPRDAAGVLPDVRGADVRRGSEVHLEMRGAPADRLTDTADIAATSKSGHAPGQRDPAPRRGLWEQVEDAARAGAHQPAWPKGRADTSDGTVSAQGRDDHGR